jgi:hypothetical protein
MKYESDELYEGQTIEGQIDAEADAINRMIDSLDEDIEPIYEITARAVNPRSIL